MAHAAPTFRRAGAPRVRSLAGAGPAPDPAALARALGAECPALLESGGADAAGRHHVLPLRPRALLVGDAAGVAWFAPDGTLLAQHEVGCLAELRRTLAVLASPRPALDVDLPFAGGLVAVLGYDLAAEIERLPAEAVDREAWPRLLAWACPAAVVIPAAGGAAVLAWLEDAGGDAGALAWGLTPAEAEELQGVVQASLAQRRAASGGPRRGGPTGAVRVLTSEAEHAAMVLRIREHLFAGDVYQANVGLRFEVPWEGSALDLHDVLRAADPAPFSGWLSAPGFEFISNSPERLVRLRGRELCTEPIAGTAPLTSGQDASPLEVEAACAALRASAKDAAEHAMIVDIHRNDLGRVSAPGTVRVEQLYRLERRAHVVHAVADIRGVLRAGADAVDVVLALFPGGCVTGVPKLRCMEIIDAVEPFRRGPWTGAFGLFCAWGDLDLAVIIRSAWLSQGRLAFAAGGGIVVGSEAKAEHAEIHAKAAALMRAVAELARPA